MTRINFKWSLPEAIEKRLGNKSYGHQRVIHENEHLLIILHAPPSTDTRERVEHVFLLDDKKDWMYNGKSDGLRKMSNLFFDYEQKYEELGESFILAESPNDYYMLISAIRPIERAIKNLANTLQEARIAAPAERDLIGFRDHANQLVRDFEILNEDLENTLKNLNLALQEGQLEEQEKMIASQTKLNKIVAITFPLMTISSIFGMNINHPITLNFAVVGGISGAAFVMGLCVKSWVSR